MIEISISGLLTVLGIFAFVAGTLWIGYVNVELKDRGELADHNVDKISIELRDIKKRLYALESKRNNE